METIIFKSYYLALVEGFNFKVLYNCQGTPIRFKKKNLNITEPYVYTEIITYKTEYGDYRVIKS